MVLLISSRISSGRDDSSISSTITVDMLDSKCEQGGKTNDVGSCSVRPFPKKRVRFSIQNSFENRLEHSSKDEIQERWYSASEYREFKRLSLLPE